MWNDKQQHQKKLLAEKDPTLQRAIDIATAAEMAVLDWSSTRDNSVSSKWNAQSKI